MCISQRSARQITHWGVWLVGNGNLREQWDEYDQAEQAVLLELGELLRAALGRFSR